MKRRLLWVGILVALVLGGVYVYQEINRKNEPVSKLKSEGTVSATSLIDAFVMNEAEANKKYLGKVLEVNGPLKAVEESGETTLVLGDSGISKSVRCLLVEKTAGEKFSVSQELKVKGICTGVMNDPLLGLDVLLDQCVVLQPEMNQ